MAKKQKTPKKEEVQKSGLTLKQELFCMIVSDYESETFCNGTKAYLKAYNLDRNNEKDYANAMQGSSRLLRNAKVLSKLEEILDGMGFHSVFADMNTYWLIKQPQRQARAKGIEIYNKLKKRGADWENKQFPSSIEIIIKKDEEKK